MATRESLARRIAKSLIDEYDFVVTDVWKTHGNPDRGGTRVCPRIHEDVLEAVLNRVNRVSSSNRGILIHTAAYRQLPLGYFMGDVNDPEARGRCFLRDACVAAIVSEMLELL